MERKKEGSVIKLQCRMLLGSCIPYVHFREFLIIHRIIYLDPIRVCTRFGKDKSLTGLCVPCVCCIFLMINYLIIKIHAQNTYHKRRIFEYQVVHSIRYYTWCALTVCKIWAKSVIETSCISPVTLRMRNGWNWNRTSITVRLTWLWNSNELELRKCNGF